MPEKVMDRSWFQYLCAWAVFGAQQSYMNSEMSLIDTDLNKDNLRYTGDAVRVIDYGGMPVIEYPKQWMNICRGLMSLFRWLDTDRTAAFRFGYLQHGGPIGRMIFNKLRSQYGFNAFRNMHGVMYEPLDLIEEQLTAQIIAADFTWRKLRDTKLRYGNLKKGKILCTHIRQWRHQRNILLLNEEERLNADEYHYLKHFCAAYLSGNLLDLLEATLNLHGINALRMRIIPAVGFLYLAKKVYNEFSNSLSNTIFEQYLKNAEENALDYYNQNVEDIDFLFKKYNPLRHNLFHFIWCLEDLEEGNVTY